MIFTETLNTFKCDSATLRLMSKKSKMVSFCIDKNVQMNDTFL